MVSVLQAEESFYSRILSRQSDIGCSSRVYYSTGCSNGVPFQWEKQPGKPINPPDEDNRLPPPLSPPPAVLSLSLSLSFNEEPKTPRTSSSPWLWLLWKKMIKRKRGRISRAPTVLRRSTEIEQRNTEKNPSCKFWESNNRSGFEVSLSDSSS
ncbi:hypothetical protein Dimus_025721 [Dionaea muscipula]